MKYLEYIMEGKSYQVVEDPFTEWKLYKDLR